MFRSRRREWTKLTQFTGDAYLQSMMGHGLRATNQADLVDKLKSRGFLTNVSHGIEQAFKETDRADFLLTKSPDIYTNSPQKIGSHFMSTPQLHAQIISLVGGRLGSGRVACEIGAGTGYLPAVFSRSGCKHVFAIENDSQLKKICEKNLHGFYNIEVSDRAPRDVCLDALYVAPYLESVEELFKLLSLLKWSTDAVVVAPVIDETSRNGPLKDQQMMILQREKNSWTMTSLFRTLCEPLAS